MQGEQELKCLNNLKEKVFYKDGQLLEEPLTHKTYLDVSDKEFNNKRTLFINSDCYKSYFGFFENDCIEFENILRTVQPNKNSNDFPDFVFDKGFIEHFQITSSQTNRKGSVHKKQDSEFVSKVESEMNSFKQMLYKTTYFDKICVKSWIHKNPIHSYEYLEKSFKKIWENHLSSLKKYTGSKEIGVFMIEYLEIALSMCEDIYHNLIDGMLIGDMNRQEKFNCYRLSRDRKLLEYIYQFKDEIKYVIFLNCEKIEIIKLENIPYLLTLMPWDFHIEPMNSFTLSTATNLTVQRITEK